MASTSRIDAAVVAMADALAGEAALSGVQILTAWMGDEEDPREYIGFVGARAPQNWVYATGRTREERITFEGVVWVLRPGKGETLARTIRARAFVLWGAVETWLRSATGKNIDGAVLQVERWAVTEMTQGILPQGRYCMLEVEIEAMARLTP